MRDSTYRICGFAVALQTSARNKPEFLLYLFVADHPMLALVVPPSSNKRTCLSEFNTVGDRAVEPFKPSVVCDHARTVRPGEDREIGSLVLSPRAAMYAAENGRTFS